MYSDFAMTQAKVRKNIISPHTHICPVSWVVIYVERIKHTKILGNILCKHLSNVYIKTAEHHKRAYLSTWNEVIIGKNTNKVQLQTIFRELWN